VQEQNKPCPALATRLKLFAVCTQMATGAVAGAERWKLGEGEGEGESKVGTAKGAAVRVARVVCCRLRFNPTADFGGQRFLYWY